MNIFDLYTYYLQIIPVLTKATGLSSILDKASSHDQVTRMLGNHGLTVKLYSVMLNLWLESKSILMVA